MFESETSFFVFELGTLKLKFEFDFESLIKKQQHNLS